MATIVLQGISGGSGLFAALAELVALVGTLVLLLILVALGGIAYKSLYGGGIDWPGDVDADDPASDDGVRRGGDDDEWKYY